MVCILHKKTSLFGKNELFGIHSSLSGMFFIFCFMSLFCVTHSYDEEKGTMDEGFPRSTEDDFPGMHDEFDAVTFNHGKMKN